MRRQLRRLGLAHDPRRTFATIDPEYVRWTQWIFLKIFDSWYDPDAERPDGGRGRARPIAELVAEYEAGTRAVPGDDARGLGRAGRRRASSRGRRPAPGLRLRDAGQLVPRAGHRAGQRGGHGRGPLRARQLPGVQAGPAPVEHADHRLRGPPGRGPRPHRLAREGALDAAQLDRPVRGRRGDVRGHRRRGAAGLHHPARHAVRRDVHGRRARAPAAGRGPRRVAGRHARRLDAGLQDPGPRGRRLPRRVGRQDRRRASGRRRPQDRRVHRPRRDQPGQRRVHPGVHRRLRADGLRHRRDHGGAGPRPAGLGLRAGLRAAGGARRSTAPATSPSRPTSATASR